MNNTFEQYLSTFHEIIKKVIITDIDGNLVNEEDTLNIIRDKFDSMKKEKNFLFLVGNGGSSGIVSHASVDILNTCKINAVPLTDNSQLTCFANDFGYEQVFSRPLETMIKPNDALIAVSSSGSSKNILNAATTVIGKNAFVITLSGFKKDNPLRKIGHINIWLDSNNYGKVEIGHALILHYITDSYSSQNK